MTDTQDTIYTYECPKCHTTMQVSIPISGMFCRNGHPMRDMVLTSTFQPTTERVRQEDPFVRQKKQGAITLTPGRKKGMTVRRKQGGRLLGPSR